ncbi:molybdopterin-guanine dinucleotide biosynthesis protein B [Archaeoglobus profundus]|uniref:Molybdopterin-guanine dinucleotide biosynthesis protein B n=1 Tax=Archaeoglobus profundus (strain DSM 5631 / JCM 9629 / NBRC 100127 / Av18) TaxID=572546 RepID=D2RGT2_ARCPA|nr:molybdopterin-guanine dinucleotide biosynthesis protein B [Archaeoglobus profundus]ADB57507.1 molybdopterin-guanine dinucleotide biosynthesis protein B [Archaeoglobus profundus DSM 5631]
MKVLCVVGKSNSGKTALIEGVVPILKKKGLVVLVIKHAKEFDIDREGKDSWRIFRSGADVVITSKEKTAFIGRIPDDLDTLIEIFKDKYDLILTEGFSSSNYPKIVVLKDGEDLRSYTNVIAVVADFNVDFQPKFRRDDYENIANFMISWIKSACPSPF